jgi:hypothetical protein
VGLGHRLTGPNAMTSQPRLLTVNIVHGIHTGYFHDTAIDKQPVHGPVELTATGLAGDRQLDPHHGSSDRAVYAYATEDANWCASELGRTIPAGLFGKNFRTQDLDVSSAIIGEKWRIGTVLLEVRMPRTPCQNLSMRIGIDNLAAGGHLVSDAHDLTATRCDASWTDAGHRAGLARSRLRPR